jgi:hypothetical protein
VQRLVLVLVAWQPHTSHPHEIKHTYIHTYIHSLNPIPPCLRGVKKEFYFTVDVLASECIGNQPLDRAFFFLLILMIFIALVSSSTKK